MVQPDLVYLEVARLQAVWIVDPEARVIEAYVLSGQGYDLALRATGSRPISLPPFSGLAPIPDDLWA